MAYAGKPFFLQLPGTGWSLRLLGSLSALSPPGASAQLRLVLGFVSWIQSRDS